MNDLDSTYLKLLYRKIVKKILYSDRSETVKKNSKVYQLGKLSVEDRQTIARALLNISDEEKESRKEEYENLAKSIYNWFTFRNKPSPKYLELLLTHLGYKSYSEFEEKNKLNFLKKSEQAIYSFFYEQPIRFRILISILIIAISILLPFLIENPYFFAKKKLHKSDYSIVLSSSTPKATVEILSYGTEPDTTYEEKDSGIIIKSDSIKLQVAGLDIQIKDNTNKEVSSALRSLIALIQAILALAAFYFIRFTSYCGRDQVKLLNSSNMPEEIKRSFSQFFSAWSYKWLFWAFLYFLLFPIWNYDLLPPEKHHVLYSFVDIMNILSSIMSYYMFMVLDEESVATAEEPDRDKAFYQKFNNFIFIVTIITAFSILDRYYYLGNFNLIGSGLRLQIDNSGDVVLSILSGLCMLYLFGRFDSSFLKASKSALAPFYLYGMIQIVYPVYISGQQANSSLVEITLLIFLFLKIYIFGMITWWLTNGNFKDYSLKQYELGKE